MSHCKRFLNDITNSGFFSIWLTLSDALNPVGHPLLIGAPARGHSIETSVKKGLDPPDISIFYPEEFSYLPCPFYAVMAKKFGNKTNINKKAIRIFCMVLLPPGRLL